ncbi:dihydrolipoyllysine-residue acetyltransferase [Rubrivivax gelatinosus]|uniref:Acetyltransferase component of pyruvate dehydrogenase complex n=1 Tax=Rubrivivax gelatinosus (strain NBRC 100245 / IL144) TaxID=983917 RepID=I0HRS0_RUBGI|nr:dihydrolipoyllysine-residue acetyltransferase [Rubrivivax gelatinosus]BAL95707.1 dihydrolipoamide acetyltransferase AceF [Rubrivivax gelatinosus IL144]
MAVVELKVPDIGDFKDVEVIELLVKPGDTIALDQSLATVESDKASMEIPAERAGTVRELKIQLRDKVSQGSVIALLEVADEAGAPAAAAAAPAAPVAAPAPAAPAGAPAPTPAPTAATASIEVLVPDIGDFAEVTVIEVFVKPGDTIKAEQSLITVESDKASMEIPSSHGGVLRELKVKLGDKVSRGSVVAVLEVAAASAPVAPVAAPAAAAAATPAAPAPAAAAPTPPASAPAVAPVPAHDPSAPVSATLPHASPSIRRYARELGVPLEELEGSGPKGRITQEDVQAFVKGVMAGEAQTRAQQAKAPAAPAAAAAAGTLPGLLPWPQVDFTKFGAVERQSLSRIKKISGANLHRNWVLIPHVTNHEDADITELEALRVQLNKENEKSGVKVTMLAFLIKACAAALKQFPEFNASLDGDELVLKKYFHIGFAADTPNGLVVPVIRDVDSKGILQISREMAELAKKARDGKLSPAEMTGGCFSISSLGGIGGTYFTPIINAPEVAILGVCRSAMKPQWNGREFVPRLMLPLSLSWDHRVIDGAAAARFNAFLASVLADFRRVML